MRFLFPPAVLTAAFALGACGSPAPQRPSVATTQSEPTVAGATLPADATYHMVVYKDPNCGCCANWVDHVRPHAFHLDVRDVSNLTAEKRRLGVPSALYACHTAEVAGYVIEGHVPVDLIRRLLNERPQIVGLAVPGMPVGSPGMEAAYKEPYEVIAFDKNGRTSVYATR
jgi:hypothetical protein